MKQQLAGLCAIALLSFISSAQAQTAGVTNPPAPVRGYDISQEVTLTGAAVSVASSLSGSVAQGFRLVLATPTGTVAVNLGAFERGRFAIPLAAGQQVEVTGVEKTLNGTRLLLARIVKVGDQTYVIRNEGGLPLSPLAHERTVAKSAKSGDSL
jgi:hypothetical protein